MNRLATLAVCMTLAAAPGLSALAQPAANPQAQPRQIQRAAEPAVRCAQLDDGSRALQPCTVRPAVQGTHLGQNVTRQEIECLLSGVCGAVDVARANS